MTIPVESRPVGRGAIARAVFGAAALLVIGAAIGIAVDRRFHTAGSHSSAAALHEAAMSDMVEEIALTPEQRHRVEAILRSRHDVMQSVWHTIHEQLGTALDSVHAEIEVVLTAEQQEAFRRWLRADRAGGRAPRGH